MAAGRRRPADRKSTRLNSSHLVISYAVFCLKKKKKHHLSRSLHNSHASSTPCHGATLGRTVAGRELRALGVYRKAHVPGLFFFFYESGAPEDLHPFPTRRSPV